MYRFMLNPIQQNVKKKKTLKQHQTDHNVFLWSPSDKTILSKHFGKLSVHSLFLLSLVRFLIYLLQ